MVTSKGARNKIRLSKIKVLVVDDDKAISNLVKNVLTNLGFGTVLVVHNGEEGFDVIQNNQIDLLITDWEMDPLSGVDLTKKIRMLEPPKRFLPIIMLTGHSERHDIEVARDSGITEYLIKPFTAKTLCSRIMMVVESPRSFILSKNYKGPSRRRRSAEPSNGVERRKKKS
ncbi:MAG: response regulator [Rickettsiales bacterium]